MDKDENIFDNTPGNDSIIPDNTENNALSNSGDADIANRPNSNTNRRPRPNGERRPNPNGQRRPRPQHGERPVRPDGERIPRPEGQRRPRPNGENRPVIPEGERHVRAEREGTPRPEGQRRPRPNGENRPQGNEQRRPRPNGERPPRPNGQHRPRPQGAAANRTQQKNRIDGKWTKKKKAIVISSIIIAALLLVAGVIAFIIYRYVNMMNIVSDSEEDNRLVSSIAPDPEDLKSSLVDSPEDKKKALEEAVRKNLEAGATEFMSDDNVLNILLIGCDGRDKDDERGRSDSMILVSLNKNNKKLVMTSFLRDTWVEIPGVGQNRLNAAYAFGGRKLLIETIETNFHIRIDKYARVTFYSFIDTIDTLGGVEIDVQQDEIQYINSYAAEENRLIGKPADADKVTKPGKQVLNGVLALGYSRIRYIGTDFERAHRQRIVMEEIFKKAEKLSLFEKNDLLEKILPNVTTNLEKGQVFSLILNSSDYLKYTRTQQSIPDLASFEGVTINGMAVLQIDFDRYTKQLKDTIYGS